MSLPARLARWIRKIWLPITAVTLWWILSEGSESPYFPPLSRIVETFRKTWLFSRFGTDVVPSARRFALGFLLAAVVGVCAGVVIGQRPLLRRAAGPVLEFARAIPAVALLPVMLSVFGVGDPMKVIFIAFGCVWPILLNTAAGVRSIDPVHLDMATAYRIGRSTQVRAIILRSALPQIFVGIRVALAIGLIVMVFSEMLASLNGVGQFLIKSQQTFAIAEMWSAIFVLGLMGLVVNMIFVLVERKVLSWYHGWRGGHDGN